MEVASLSASAIQVGKKSHREQKSRVRFWVLYSPDCPERQRNITSIDGTYYIVITHLIVLSLAFVRHDGLLPADVVAERNHRGAAQGPRRLFSPNSVLSHNSSGTGQPFGGRTAFSDGAMLSDLGSPEVTVGKQPVVDQPEDDGSDVVLQPRPHRDDVDSKAPDLGGRPPPRPPPQQVRNSAAAGPVPVAVATAGRGDIQRKPSEAELRAELDKREKQSFDQAAQQIRDVVNSDPQLQELARQLVIDTTPDGLRIQIRDADRKSMFAFGSAEPNEKTRLLLQKMAPVLAKLTQDISIACHTDAAPFAGAGPPIGNFPPTVPTPRDGC